MPTDPVCGMTVEEKTAAGTSTYHGTVFYFCSPTCLRHFEAHPADFIAADQRDPQPEARTEAEPPRSGTTATPTREMAKDPICGMVVEKATALQAQRGGRTYYFCSPSCLRTFESPEAELTSMRRRATIHATGQPQRPPGGA